MSRHFSDPKAKEHVKIQPPGAQRVQISVIMSYHFIPKQVAKTTIKKRESMYLMSPWRRERLPTPWTIVHRVEKSWTRPSDFHFHL